MATVYRHVDSRPDYISGFGHIIKKKVVGDHPFCFKEVGRAGGVFFFFWGGGGTDQYESGIGLV